MPEFDTKPVVRIDFDSDDDIPSIVFVAEKRMREQHVKNAEQKIKEMKKRIYKTKTYSAAYSIISEYVIILPAEKGSIKPEKALRISFDKVAQIVSDELAKILNRKVDCIAQADDIDYWAVKFKNERVPISEIYKVLNLLSEDEKQHELQAFNELENKESIGDLGMLMSEALLKQFLGYSYETVFTDNTSIWLLGEKPESEADNNV